MAVPSLSRLALSRLAPSRLALGLGTAAVAVALSACGSDPGTDASAGPVDSTAPAGTAVTATEADFSITLSDRTLSPGTYTFTVQNTGSATHSPSIEGPGGVDETSDAVQGGESTTLTVTLQAGDYEVYCPIADHRAMGMDTTLTVS